MKSLFVLVFTLISAEAFASNYTCSFGEQTQASVLGRKMKVVNANGTRWLKINPITVSVEGATGQAIISTCNQAAVLKVQYPVDSNGIPQDDNLALTASFIFDGNSAVSGTCLKIL